MCLAAAIVLSNYTLAFRDFVAPGYFFVSEECHPAKPLGITRRRYIEKSEQFPRRLIT